MDESYRQKRHTELWEEQNRQIRRTVIAGLIFGAFILFNVLDPYAGQRTRYVSLESKIAELEAEKLANQARLVHIEESRAEFESLRQQISQEPWAVHKDQLIRTYRDMRLRGEGDPQTYQRLADETIDRITVDVETISGRTLTLLEQDQELASAAPRLPGAIAEIQQTLADWREEHIGEVWYATIDSKGDTLYYLVSDLNREFRQAAEVLEAAQQRVRPEVQATVEELEAAVALQATQLNEGQDALDELQDKMESILPEWVQGMVTIDQMARYFPLIMLGLGGYILVTGWALSGHYRVIAECMGWSPAERRDPVYSSLWTLTWRGSLGTALTLATYLFTLGSLWYFFEQGAALFAPSPAADGGNVQAAVPAGDSALRLAWLVAIALVLYRPLRDSDWWPASRS